MARKETDHFQAYENLVRNRIILCERKLNELLCKFPKTRKVSEIRYVFLNRNDIITETFNHFENNPNSCKRIEHVIKKHNCYYDKTAYNNICELEDKLIKRLERYFKNFITLCDEYPNAVADSYIPKLYELMKCADYYKFNYWMSDSLKNRVVLYKLTT